MTIESFTNTGGREVNEDYVAVKEKDGSVCCVLCDGLGGHGRGEEASKLVAEKIIELFEDDDDFINHIDNAFETAQKDLLAEQKTKFAKHEMKTTATVLVIKGNEARWGHIGDSRLYYFKRNKVKTRTLDHSVPQMLVLAHEIKEKEIRNHPDRNKLLRVMGVEWGNSKYEISPVKKVKPGNAFLLSSDGFWELIEEKKMSEILEKSQGATEWIGQMAEIVAKAGEGKKQDNYSAIAVII